MGAMQKQTQAAEMRILRLIATLILLISMIEKTSGTAQIPDFLIYKGDTLSIYANPLESYFDSISRPDSIFDKYGYNSTACWRGYIGFWELKNDSLFLLELQGDSTIIDLSLIFNDRKTDTKIFADWVDDSILNPYGKLVLYEHMGYASIYEFEREFIFSKGVLTGIQEYDNSKSRRCKFTENTELLKEFIKANVNYANVKNKPYEKARVFVQICSVTEDGKIDRVKVICGWDNERDKEAIRVVKLIPEWDIVYRHGKQIHIPWIIPVTFGENE
ncbi:MAG: hypothetical protein QM786_09995 [Breznakibacter sp.]